MQEVKNDIHIHTVLHLNKRDDNAPGHVGTELKSEVVGQKKNGMLRDTMLAYFAMVAV